METKEKDTETNKNLTKIGPSESIMLSVAISIVIGLTFALPSGLGILGGLAIALIVFGIMLKGAFTVTVPLNHVAVLKLLGERQKIIFTEGWNMTIPFITGFELVDMREKVCQIPDPEKEAGKDGFTFFTGVRPEKGERVELKAKVVLKYKINDALKYLDNDPKAIGIALITKSVDEIRTHGANMSAEEFIADKDKVADEVKKAVDKQYVCITVTGLDIAKADYANEEIKKNEQAAKLEESKTKSQYNDMLGANGTSQRISKVAEMLTKAGLPADEATRKAIEIVQTQEGRMTHARIELSGGSNPITEAVALWKGGKI